MHWRKAAVTANAIAVLIVAVVFVQYGTSAEHSARIRNSLIATFGETADLEWSPAEAPKSFLIEIMPPPRRFAEVVAELMVEGDVDRESAMQAALLLARHLVATKEHGGAIRSDSVTAYDEIVSHGRGYCADYSQVFSGLAIAAGIPVREWGMGFDGFGFGHTVNEIFDADYGKWILIDSFHSLYVADERTGEPLSVIELQEILTSGQAGRGLRFVAVSEEKYAFKSTADARDYYQRGADQFYLIWGNNVFTYDSDPLVRRLGSISRALETSVAIVTGVHPSIRIARTDANGAHIAKLRSTRIKFIALFILLIVISVSLVFQLWWYVRTGGR